MFFWLNEACRFNRIEIQNHLPPGTILEVHSKNPTSDVGVKQLKDAIVPIIMEFHDNSFDPRLFKKKKKEHECVVYRIYLNIN
ncbi:unnamed protein product [Arabidopsis halleri]